MAHRVNLVERPEERRRHTGLEELGRTEEQNTHCACCIDHTPGGLVGDLDRVESGYSGGGCGDSLPEFPQFFDARFRRVARDQAEFMAPIEIPATQSG